ncbi:hypothetical protein FIBSPDRAFT_867827 [Athelia psychrophila]|uniref:Uncharacterized protein n=1 Tax=Athelia psychrophila TaxID=1759441 RepID=A0A166DLS6_9AGAM|nr:hypothetical protein FIBSPDRAFT_867827 [Fibularhizoctonia sp. CBS 109695]
MSLCDPFGLSLYPSYLPDVHESALAFLVQLVVETQPSLANLEARDDAPAEIQLAAHTSILHLLANMHEGSSTGSATTPSRPRGSRPTRTRDRSSGARTRGCPPRSSRCSPRTRRASRHDSSPARPPPPAAR